MNIISDLVSTVKRFGVEFVFNRYYGIYPATVWDNKDPNGMGCVRVNSLIFGHVDNRGFATKHNQWVVPLFPDMIYDPPEIGSDVWIQFVSGNINSPVYVGTRRVPGDSRFSEFQAKANQSPKKRAIKTSGGLTISFDDEANEIKIVAAGNTILINSSGVKINESYLVTEKFLDFMNAHVEDFGLGNLGAPVPLNPAKTLPDFVQGYTTKADFKTDKAG
ncbi:MAG: hypothetical protein HQK96_04125 [Nitrospirae bacterium]|nr:hypothetical protein [Nitrospirota bacterium]